MIAYEYVFLIGMFCWINGLFVATIIFNIKNIPRSKPYNRYKSLKNKYLKSALQEKQLHSFYYNK